LTCNGSACRCRLRTTFHTQRACIDLCNPGRPSASRHIDLLCNLLQRFTAYRSTQLSRITRIATPQANSKTLDPDFVSAHVFLACEAGESIEPGA
jgi:hypothetical protein